MEITTNNVPRNLIYGNELTQHEKEEFDYIDEIEMHNFVKYKGVIYDIGSFTRADGIDNWDGVSPETYFSGVLVRLLDDADMVIMGHYLNP